MNEFNWNMRLGIGDLNAEYRWREFLHNDKSLGYQGEVIDLDTGMKIYDSSSNDWIVQSICSASSSFRKTELNKQYENIISSSHSSPELLDDLIIDLYEQSTQGVYLGQISNNQLFYVQDLSQLLNFPNGFTLRKIDALIRDKRIGLNGMILISYEQYAENKKKAEIVTGHKGFNSSDFGNWFCSVCNQDGDEYTNPREFPCI